MSKNSGFKPTYGVGYKGVSKTGEPFEVISYEGRKKIGIRFQCGYEKNTTSTHIKNKSTPYKRVCKTHLGDNLVHKSGMRCEVIGYKLDSDLRVRFENGAEKNCSYLDVLDGKVSTSLQQDLVKVGEVYPTNRFGDVTVTKYNSANSVEVMFEDGTPFTTYASTLRKGNVGHPRSGIPEGFTFTNGDGEKGTVYKFHSCRNVDVLWHDGVVTKNHGAAMVKNGTIYYPNFKSVVGVGYFGIGKYKPNRSGGNLNYNPVVYRKWMQMITRCYNPYEINKDSCKAYKDVHVCDEWHNFQNFALWAESRLDKFVDGYELDKDMFGTGYLYCPEYCTLLPDQINGFLSNNYSNKQSDLPEGVNVISPKTKNSKVGYVARCHIKGVREYLGYYNTPDEAGEVYLVAKEKEAKRLAEAYKHKMSQTEYEEMFNFKLSDIHRK